MNYCSHRDNKPRTNYPPTSSPRVSAVKYLVSERPLRQLHRLSSLRVRCRSCRPSRQVTEQEVCKLLTNTPAKSCTLDPVPTWFLKQVTEHIAPVICYLCNLSLQTGIFPATLKHALVHPRLKKPTIDIEVPNNYRPISNSYLKFIIFIQVSRTGGGATFHIACSRI